jgi:hypothetical protein
MLAHATSSSIFLAYSKDAFTIFSHPPKYNMKLQVCLPLALGAVHNFIHIHDPEEIDKGAHKRYGTLALGPARHAERLRAVEKL